MNMPGFTAELAVSSKGTIFRSTLAITEVEREPKVTPQLRLTGIGSCMANCRMDDYLCLFRCLAADVYYYPSWIA